MSTEAPINKTIFDLDLHEECHIQNNWVVLRVPGGWLYTHWEYRQQENNTGRIEQWTDKHSTFIPYSEQAKIDQMEHLLKT